MTSVFLRRIILPDSAGEKNQTHSAAVRQLLHDCLVLRYGRSADHWLLQKTSEGKPYLALADMALLSRADCEPAVPLFALSTAEGGRSDTQEGLSDGYSVPPHISLSHSGEWVACALSRGPVGVDVQTVRPISAGVRKRFLNCEADSADVREQTLLWTRYEACLKRYGSRLAMRAEATGQAYDSFFEIPSYITTVCHADTEPVCWTVIGH